MPVHSREDEGRLTCVARFVASNSSSALCAYADACSLAPCIHSLLVVGAEGPGGRNSERSRRATERALAAGGRRLLIPRSLSLGGVARLVGGVLHGRVRALIALARLHTREAVSSRRALERRAATGRRPLTARAAPPLWLPASSASPRALPPPPAAKARRREGARAPSGAAEARAAGRPAAGRSSWAALDSIGGSAALCLQVGSVQVTESPGCMRRSTARCERCRRCRPNRANSPPTHSSTLRSVVYKWGAQAGGARNEISQEGGEG